jgi:cyclic pyranopterin phosphate synthase
VPQLHTALTTDPIDVGQLVAEMRGDGDGAIASFIGVVRDAHEGRTVLRLDYEAYLPMADRELRRLAAEVAERHGLSALALVHRVGSLVVGEVSVVVVTAAPHRRPALLACAEAVEALKRDLPVWKREHYPDGAVWIDARDLDDDVGPGAKLPRGPSEAPDDEVVSVATLEGAGSGPDPGAELERSRLSHVGASGAFQMVDITDRAPTHRAASAEALVRFSDPATLVTLRAGSAKGDVLAAARLAGIMAAKRTPELIPLCHPLPLTHVEVTIEVDDSLPGVRIVGAARCAASTGVEMEALTAVTVAGLTIIDMLKSADPWMTIESVQLLSKSGGRSGERRRP